MGISNSIDGLAALVNKLDNLGRDMKKLKESVHAIRVGCQICEGPHLDKYCTLNEEVKQVKEVKYGEFGQTMPFKGSNGGKFRVGPPGYYTNTDNRPPYGEKRQSLEELLAKHQEESARKSSTTINRGFIQANPTSLPPRPIREATKHPTFEEYHLESKGDTTYAPYLYQGFFPVRNDNINQYSGLKNDTCTWMSFGGNTRDLGSFGEETDKITDLHQELSSIVFTERGDGVAGIKRRRRDLSSDGVRNSATASGRGRLKEDLESSTWRRSQDF
ncbi:hypothetical protein Tco_0452406 [Tanacetum coccineum]